MIGWTIHSLSECSANPNLDAIVGTRGHSAILSQISRDFSGGQVFFGTEYDRFSKEYADFTKHVTNPFKEADERLAMALQVSIPTDHIFALESEEQYIPPSMWLPILTHPVVRQAYLEETIKGFGLSPDEIPEEDVAGRLINNGRITSADIAACKEANKPVMLRWTWKTGDPLYSADDLRNLEETRNFVVDTLLSSMQTKDIVDLTDPQRNIKVHDTAFDDAFSK